MRPLKITAFLFLTALFTAFFTACPQENDEGHSRPTPRPSAPSAPSAPSPAPASPPRLLVVPFESLSVPRSAKQYTFALAAHLAERLEEDSAVKALNGPLVLTREQAQLLQSDGSATEAAIIANSTVAADGTLMLRGNPATYDPQQFLSLAKSVGAEYVIAGRFSGPIWDCKIDVEVWRIGERLNKSGQTETYRTIAARHFVKADWTVPGKSRYGRDIRLTSAAKIHESFAEAVNGALAKAGITLAPATVTAIATPPSQDAYALLLMSRAYVAMYFAEDRNPVKNADGAIKAAARAMSVDPRHFYEAQRLYAKLLYDGGNRGAARVHFEEAVKINPNDVRSLVRLGVIESENRSHVVARGYLERAAKLRPFDADIAFWLGKAALATGDKVRAQSEFERARTLDPDHADSRRELALLYSLDRRYADAAAEIREVLRVAPEDRDAHFLYGACLRADGRIEEAAEAYGRGGAIFGNDPRFPKFRGDMLMKLGRPDEARRSYWTARWMNFFDRRLSRAVGKGIVAPPQLGGDELIGALHRAFGLRGELDRNRSLFYLGTNDAILDLLYNGEQACLDGHGASSALTASQAKERFDEVRREQAILARQISVSRDFGEWDAFTPDERQEAEAVLANAAAARQDATEMRSQYMRTFLPLYVQNNCPEYDGPITPATVEQMMERYRRREVTLPPAARPPMLPIAPDVPPMPALTIGFTIDNTEGQAAILVQLDGQTVATVPAGERQRIMTTVGPHDLCVERTEAACRLPENIRNIYLHDGWTMRVRPRR